MLRTLDRVHRAQQIELALVQDYFFRGHVFVLSGQIRLFWLLIAQGENLVVEFALRHLLQLADNLMKRRLLVDLSFALWELLH